MVQKYILPDFKPENISYGFFGRQGGVSKGIYESLNCRVGSDDVVEDTAENRRRVCEVIGAEPDHLFLLYQIHSDKVVVAEKPWGMARPEADGIVTDQPGKALGILTADCVPVLFSGVKDDGAPVIGAAHAGWKGALGGVLDQTVAKMKELGAVEIQAAIGPCIAKKSYEISDEFFENFVEADEGNERFFSSARKKGHLMFDLPGYAAMRLSACGVKKVLLSDVDTYSNESEYFSFRRKTHRGESDYGGQLSVIMISGSLLSQG